MVLCFWTSYYRPRRSWGKAIFSETCVKNSVHMEGVHGKGGMHGGGHAWQGCAWQGACMEGRSVWQEGHAWQGGHVCQEGMHGMHAAPQQILRDMVNERAVRILVECILVLHFVWKKYQPKNLRMLSVILR